MITANLLDNREDVSDLRLIRNSLKIYNTSPNLLKSLGPIKTEKQRNFLLFFLT